jgi:hypothetical protein
MDVMGGFLKKADHARLHVASGNVALVQAPQTIHGRFRDGTHEIEESESSERLGDEFEEFVDYAICKLKNEFAP